MATKNQAPDAFQKQFNKIQFKINAPVIFTWLGMKKYGYVIRTKETNWGIQYTVQDVDAKYPCGIIIKTHKTTYNTGCILYDDSRSIGEIELTRRINITYGRPIKAVSRNSGGSESESRSNNINVTRVSNTIVSNATTETHISSTIVDESSNTRMHNNNTKKRTNSKLDTAIQKQKNFLNGFVKKD